MMRTAAAMKGLLSFQRVLRSPVLPRHHGDTCGRSHFMNDLLQNRREVSGGANSSGLTYTHAHPTHSHLITKIQHQSYKNPSAHEKRSKDPLLLFIISRSLPYRPIRTPHAMKTFILARGLGIRLVLPFEKTTSLTSPSTPLLHFLPSEFLERISSPREKSKSLWTSA